jgi:hypothetical protein
MYPNAAPFGQQKLGVRYEIEVIVNKPTSPVSSACFFVSRPKENDIALEWDAGTLQ